MPRYSSPTTTAEDSSFCLRRHQLPEAVIAVPIKSSTMCMVAGRNLAGDRPSPRRKALPRYSSHIPETERHTLHKQTVSGDYTNKP